MCVNYTEYRPPEVGDTHPQAIEAEFNINLDNRVYVRQISPSYHRLTDGEIQKLNEELKTRYSEKSVGVLLTFFRNMKNASMEPENSQTYDWLVRQALECTGYIRQGGNAVQKLSPEVCDLYTEYYRVTQAFLRREFPSRSVNIYRGLYSEEYSKIAEAMIKEPYREGYLIQSPAATSYSLSRDIAEKFEEGIIAEWTLIDNTIAFAADMLHKHPSHQDPEGELHVMAGNAFVRSDSFVMRFNDEIPLIKAIRLMSTPNSLDEDDHGSILDLLNELFAQEIQIDDQQANTRLWTWFEHCERNTIFDSKTETFARKLVQYVVGKKETE